MKKKNRNCRDNELKHTIIEEGICYEDLFIVVAIGFLGGRGILKQHCKIIYRLNELPDILKTEDKIGYE